MKIQWNAVTWYSRILALILLIALPFVGFYIGTIYQQAISPQINTTTNPATPVNKNPNPGALDVRDIFSAPWKYTDQKVKISARIDIHTGLTSVMCPQNSQICERYKGTIYLKDINAATGNTSNEIELGEKTKTDPSTYVEFSCSSTTSPIQICLSYKNGNLTELEGTLVRFPADQINQYTYMLII